MLSQKILQYKLQDDQSLTGGIAHVGETVQEFIDSVNGNFKNVNELNLALRECGIQTI